MLNYIWVALIVSSFVFALAYDVRDLSSDRYRNGAALALELSFPNGYDDASRATPVRIAVDGDQYGSHFGTPDADDATFDGTLIRTVDGPNSGSRRPRPCRNRWPPSPACPGRTTTSSRAPWWDSAWPPGRRPPT